MVRYGISTKGKFPRLKMASTWWMLAYLSFFTSLSGLVDSPQSCRNQLRMFMSPQFGAGTWTRLSSNVLGSRQFSGAFKHILTRGIPRLSLCDDGCLGDLERMYVVNVTPFSRHLDYSYIDCYSTPSD